jgi:hypothetical protein
MIVADKDHPVGFECTDKRLSAKALCTLQRIVGAAVLNLVAERRDRFIGAPGK